MTDKVTVARIMVFFGVLNSKSSNFAKTTSEQQDGGTLGLFPQSLSPVAQVRAGCSSYPAECSGFLSLRRSKSNGEEVYASSAFGKELETSPGTHSLLGMGKHSQTLYFGYSPSVSCPQIHCGFLSCIFM